MRSQILFLGGVGWAAALWAAVPACNGGGPALADWMVVPAESRIESACCGLTLPAGAQLVRSVGPGGLVVKIACRLPFGSTAQDCPALEIGSAALVFARTGDMGRMSLVLGDAPAVDLPLQVALDASGRSREVLSIEFGWHGTAVSVVVGGQVQRFPTGALDGSEREVVLSAGESSPWGLERLEVVFASDGATLAEPANPAGVGKSAPERGASPGASPGQAAGIGGGGAFGPGGCVDSVDQPAPRAVGAPVPERGLEVFTPSAIRHGRANAVRAAVAGRTAG